MSVIAQYYLPHGDNTWFNISKEIDNIKHITVKKYFELVLPYGWKHFYFYRISSDRRPPCYLCREAIQKSYLGLSCDAGGCSFPRFKPHTIIICVNCIHMKKIPDIAPSCCFEQSPLIKSTNKQG